MTAEPAEALSRALERLSEAGSDAARLPEALELLLAAWRGKRSPVIADLVDAVSIACRDGQSPLLGDTAEHHVAWHQVEREGRAADLERLLEAVLVRTAEESVERLAALAARPPNPRLVTGLSARLAADSFSYAQTAFWRAAENALTSVGDVRLRKLSVPSRARRAAAAHPPPEALTADEAALCDQIATVLARGAKRNTEARRGGEELLSSVYESPEDDGPRLVYADWLTERGDPRGELIVLQFQRRDAVKVSRVAASRERALLKEHARSWLVEIDPFVRRESVRFERGFAHALRLIKDVPLRTSIEIGAWSTVAEIDLVNTSLSADGTLWLLNAPGFRGLEVILGAEPAFFERLLSGANEAGKKVSSIARHEALLGRLRRLGGRGAPRPADLVAMVALLARAPRLRELAWYGSSNSLVALLRWMIEAAPPAPLEQFVHATATATSMKDVVVLERGEDGRLSRLRLTDMAPAVASWPALLETLGRVVPGAIRQLVVETPPKDADAMTAVHDACRVHGVTVVVGPCTGH